MIRIAFVIPTLDQSGAERQLTLLATHLPRDQYQVRVIALNRGGHFAATLGKHSIDVEVLEKRFRFDPMTWVRLRHSLRNEPPDLIQSFLFSANAYVRLPRVAPSRTKVIVSERCVDSWKSGWQLSIDRRLSGRMDAMTTNSESVKDFYVSTVGVSKELITVIPNAVGQSKTANRETVREQLGLRSDHRVIGYCGRLAPQKCLSDLVWAFHLLLQDDQNTRLLIIGDGPQRDELSELAEHMGSRNEIQFLGHRQDAAEIMAALDVFCLPSEFEGMSNSLMEAMSIGIPVVASDIAANRELVRDAETGLLFKHGDGPDLARAVKQVLDDRSFAARVASAAQTYIMTNHSVDQLVKRHCELYSRLLTNNSAE